MSATPGEVVAERLKALREARGWSQADLAQRLDMARPTITAVEAGRRRTTIDDLCSLAVALQVAPTWLYTWPIEENRTIAINDEVTVPPDVARSWAKGETAVPPDAAWSYFTHVPPDQQHEVFTTEGIEMIHTLTLQLRTAIEREDETVEQTVAQLVSAVEDELLRQRSRAARRTADPLGP